jgi:hypothetical protein
VSVTWVSLDVVPPVPAVASPPIFDAPPEETAGSALDPLQAKGNPTKSKLKNRIDLISHSKLKMAQTLVPGTHRYGPSATAPKHY